MRAVFGSGWAATLDDESANDVCSWHLYSDAVISMTLETTAAASHVPRLYHFLTRTGTAITFHHGVLTVVGAPGRHRVTVPFEDIDEVVETGSWFGARLTIRALSGSQYAIAGLPRAPAASVAAALRNEGVRRARQVAGWCLERERQVRSALAGERYLRHGEGENLRRQLEPATSAARPAIVRRHLGRGARQALDRLESAQAAAEFEQARADANRRFVSAAIPAVKRATAAALAFDPTDEQAAAIATDEEATLVLAGAGTGKTGVITGKIAHLVHNCGVAPEEILVLAFNRKAAEEIRQRIGGGLSGCEVRTFHAFGRMVMGRASSMPTVSLMATDDTHRSQQIDRILGDLIGDAADARKMLDFVAYHGQPYRSPFEFADLSAYHDYTRSIELRTLNGDLVKSHEELVIANFLARKGVKVKYEAPYPVETADSRHRQYQPDFYLPDYDIYIEHFALNENGQAPRGWHRYRESADWKRSIHTRHGTRLIETYSWQHGDRRLLHELERRLREYGVRFEPVPPERLLQSLRATVVSWLSLLLAAFLNLVKTAGLTMRELRQRTSTHPLSGTVRSRAFLDLFERVWLRYEALLKEENAIDFNDLINRATEVVEAGRWQSSYRYVLVDEFQDISAGRLALLKALKRQSVAYFLVGDDWQSIYRFAGSDVGLMSSCGDHLGSVKRRELGQTFRYGAAIAGPSSAFVQRNPAQIKRTLKGRETGADDGVTVIAAVRPADGAARALAD